MLFEMVFRPRRETEAGNQRRHFNEMFELQMRIPIDSGRVSRLEAGHHSDLKTAGYLEVGVFVWVSPSGIKSLVDQRGEADASP